MNKYLLTDDKKHAFLLEYENGLQRIVTSNEDFLRLRLKGVPQEGLRSIKLL